MNTIGDLVLHLELVLLHLEDVIFIDRLLFFADTWWVLKEHSWRPPCEWTLAQVHWHMLRVWVCRHKRFNFGLVVLNFFDDHLCGLIFATHD